MKSKILLLLLCVVALTAGFAHASAICPTTASTNTDCGYVFTIGVGGTITGAVVTGANPYDGSDDALIGVVNNSGKTYTGSIALSGTGNGGGIFGFDGDGICAYVSHTTYSYCNTAPTGYEGPNNTFSGINAGGTAGSVNIVGLLAGGTTFFSLEGSPQSINPVFTTTPEPGSLILLSTGMVSLVTVARRRLFR